MQFISVASGQPCVVHGAITTKDQQGLTELALTIASVLKGRAGYSGAAYVRILINGGAIEPHVMCETLALILGQLRTHKGESFKLEQQEPFLEIYVPVIITRTLSLESGE